MTVKTMEVVICDLHKTDRPATRQITIDVCEMHAGVIEAKVLAYPCDQCDRAFSKPASLTHHKTVAHANGKAKTKRRK
jgi:hypothetical protein